MTLRRQTKCRSIHTIPLSVGGAKYLDLHINGHLTWWKHIANRIYSAHIKLNQQKAQLNHWTEITANNG